jgi:hypothetical protein
MASTNSLFPTSKRRSVRSILILMAMFALAALASATPVITITSPAASATVSSPAQVTASATSSGAVSLMQVYVDGVKKYEVKAAKISTTLSLASGAHRLTVVATDGTSVKSYVNFTVAASSSAVPSTAITTNDIDQKTGWGSCDVCAGPGGAGATVPHSVTYGQADPAMDGNSVKFHIGDSSTSQSYATALWWQYAGASDNYKHFIYDVHFYLKDPAAAQALEFDVNQTRKADGVKYIFGTECDIRGTHVWRVYDNLNKKWTSTGVTCSAPTAYAWHHLVWEFARTSAGPQFVSLTLDGVKHYVNMQVNKRSGTGNSTLLNVAVQLDGNGVTKPYDEWVDGITITRW